MQVIRSKIPILIHCGGPPPPYPDWPQPWSKTQTRAAERYAIYTLTQFSPWVEHEQPDGQSIFLPMHGTGWAGFCLLASQLKTSQIFTEKAKFIRIQRQGFALKISSSKKDALGKYRFTRAAHLPRLDNDPVAKLAAAYLVHGYYERFTTDDNSASIDDIAVKATRRQLEEFIAANSAVLTAAQLRNIDKKAHESKLVCESLEALYSPMFSTTWQASIEQSGSSSNLQGQPMGRQPPPASSTFTHIRKEGELPPKQIHTYLRKEGHAIFDKVQEPMPTELAHAQSASDQRGTEPQQDEGQSDSLSPNADQKKIIDLFCDYAVSYQRWQLGTANTPITGQASHQGTQVNSQKPTQLLVIVHGGGPGVGKSFMSNYLVTYLKELGIQSRQISFTGVASSLLLGGATIHSSLGINTSKMYQEFDDLPEESK